MSAQHTPLKGEGDVKVSIETRVRRQCDNCGEPATKKHTYCFANGRTNPASSMYGKDDCTYCADAAAFSCDECNDEVRKACCPDGMNWGSTFSISPSFGHLFLHWESRPATASEIAAIAQAEGRS